MSNLQDRYDAKYQFRLREHVLVKIGDQEYRGRIFKPRNDDKRYQVDFEDPWINYRVDDVPVESIRLDPERPDRFKEYDHE